MSAHMRGRPTKQALYKIVIERPGKTKWFSFLPASHFRELEAFLEKCNEADSTPWEELAKERVAKYKKAGLALRGARYREGMSQKGLAKRTGVSQENISKMENGQRAIGLKVAKKLAKALKMDARLLTDV